MELEWGEGKLMAQSSLPRKLPLLSPLCLSNCSKVSLCIFHNNLNVAQPLHLPFLFVCIPNPLKQRGLIKSNRSQEKINT